MDASSPGGTGPITSISAVTLATADMAAAVTFYEAMGFRLLYGGAGAPFTSLAAGTGYLNLQSDPDHPRLEHVWGRVIFWVDDVDALYARALGAGMSPEASPVDATWGERYFHIRDPDGHEVSFAKPL